MKFAPLLLPLFFTALTGEARAQCSVTIADALDLAPGSFTSVGIYDPLGAGEATGNFTCSLTDDYVMMNRPGNGPLNPFGGPSGETGFIISRAPGLTGMRCRLNLSINPGVYSGNLVPGLEITSNGAPVRAWNTSGVWHDVTGFYNAGTTYLKWGIVKPTLLDPVYFTPISLDTSIRVMVD